MAATDVIFRIGTVGISRASADMAIIVGLLYKIGQAVADNVKKADQFADAWHVLSTEQKSAVNAMDTATKGFISTMDSMHAVGKVAAAGIKPTNTEMEALAKIAAVTAKNLGEGPEGAKTRLDALTDSLIKGNSRGLKPYGIELKSTGTLAEKQAEALGKITERAKGLSIEMDGLDDKYTALSNAMNKTLGLTYEHSDKLGIFSAIANAAGFVMEGYTNKINEYNNAVVATNGNINELIYSGDTFTLFIQRTALDVAETTSRFYGWNDALSAVIGRQKELTDEMRKQLGISQSGYKGPYGYGGIRDQGKGSPLASSGGGYGYSPTDTGKSRLADLLKKKKPPSGGGARREMVAETQELYFPNAPAELADLIGTLDESRLQTVNDILSGVSGITAEMQTQADMTTRQIELESESAEERMQRLQDMMGTDPSLLTPDEKYEVWDAEYEHAKEMRALEDEEAEYLEKKYKLLEKGESKSKQHFLDTRAGLIMHQAALEANTGAARVMFKAMWDGSITSGAAVRRMIGDIMQGMSIEYGVKAAAEAVEALICIAKQDYVTAAEHGVAAGSAAAVAASAAMAAILLGRGGASHRHTATQGGAFGGGASGAAGGSQGYSGATQEGPTEIVINVDGSLAGLFDALAVTATKKKKAGSYNGGGF